MSRILVDSNVLLDVLTRDPQWFEWSSIHLHDALLEGAAINQLIYAEISTNFKSPDEVDSLLSLAPFEDCRFHGRPPFRRHRLLSDIVSWAGFERRLCPISTSARMPQSAV